jgi:hypothetical protein
MPHHGIRLLLACALLAASCLAVPASSTPLRSASSTIDISGLTSFLATLPSDEQDEQLRDWAVYGLMGGSAPDGGVPVRHAALRETEPRIVSPGRVFVLSAREWGVLLAPELLRDRALIGSLVDGRRATTDALPERVALFSYTYNAPTATITVIPAGSVPARELFTATYGYHAAVVRTLADLTGFLGEVDDLVSAERRPEGLLLGGRRFGRDARRSVTTEEVAALFQAYNPPADASARTRYDASLSERYERTVARDRKLRKALARGTTSREAVLVQLRRRYPFRPAPGQGGSVGFSLDPERDYATLAADLEGIARQASLAPPARRELAAAAERIRTRRDIQPLLALRQRYQRSAGITDQRFGELLRATEARNTYQAARYDGNLQGTRPAMVLFYTDLLAKLWALDYNGITPKGAVKGMRTIQEISVPKLFWPDMVRLSQTRLWFGLRKEGFDLYGDRLLFQPVATRVYAASFDPLAPGRETQPNYQSREFLGWWDGHYEAIADYEPAYHRLNEIQKWSALFVVLNEQGNRSLDFLRTVPVTRDLDFSVWSRNNASLKTRIDIPFLDRRRYGRTTECLPLLTSRDYRLMGANHVMSGGVSLASRQEILAKLHEHDAPSSPSAKPPAKNGAGAKGGGQKEAKAAVPTRGRAPSAGTAHKTGAPGAGYGSFRAEQQPRAVKLTWERSPSVVMADLVNALAARQQANPRMHRGEGVFAGLPGVESVVRVKAGSAYLVKAKGIGDGWIYVSVNPAQPSGYPARAAADFPEADIFCARLVAGAAARKLGAGKAVVR